ncbi:MAG: hypothetical protein RI900_2817, partial [Actinomycetota bacterium]
MSSPRKSPAVRVDEAPDPGPAKGREGMS